MAPQRFREQFQQIQRAMSGVPLAMGPDDSAEFMYEKGWVLARDGEEAALVEHTVRAHFTRDPDLSPHHVRRSGPAAGRSGVTRIRVGDPGEGGPEGDRAVAAALHALREAEERAGRPLAGRNHVVSIAVNACPGDEPAPAPDPGSLNPAPVPDLSADGTSVSVLVPDTGLTHDARFHPLLARTRGDTETRETDGEGFVRPYVGHGTFIAGLVAAVAPHTAVTVCNTLDDAGAVLESEFGDRLFQAVDDHGWPDILSLSAGTTTGSATTGLLGLEAFMAALRARPGTLLVAAAGNNGSTTPFWPAAYTTLPGYEDAVLSVGALRDDGASGACFTNHGPWVAAYAPGERLVSAFTGFDGPARYRYQHSTYDSCRYGLSYGCTCRLPAHTGVLSEDGTPEPATPDEARFEGLAHWSGTSFAAPLAAAMIASWMAAHKETDPRAARRQLLEAGAGTAQVRGDTVLALRPSSWRPVPTPDPLLPS